MSDILRSIFLGLIQGLTEFLPVSSSGHLAFVQNVFDIELESSGFFDILLHLGTLISVLIYYRRDIWDILKHLTKRRMVPLVLIGTVPLVLSVLLKGYEEILRKSNLSIGIAWVVTGLLLILSDKIHFVTSGKTEETAKFRDAAAVGVVQAIAAVFPGLSRSGSTITAGLFCGLDRKFAVKFSFLLSVPAIIGANILGIKDAIEIGVDSAMLPVYAVGVLAAAVSGYGAIRVVNWISEKAKFTYFGIYCLIIGAAAIVLGVLL
ncbi:MAG: undecaprenyl-diphosphate phosphatase [Oscillospiraceae bacterium]|jgi:undecaprenyl-diphosphatase|nr:undecaprenyl-diphosphate phosphatase [Oscillospiraceae bacterium]